MKTSTKAPTETEALFRDLNKPSLHALSYALRHPDSWPDGFIWDYGYCDNCAMGLAHKLWSSSVPEPSYETNVGTSNMARSFAMPYEEAEVIFYAYDEAWVPRTGHLWWRGPDRSLVTPEMIADQIDAYLARAE